MGNKKIDSELGDACTYNHGVCCTHQHTAMCNTCGFAPRVHIERMMRIKDELLQKIERERRENDEHE